MTDIKLIKRIWAYNKQPCESIPELDEAYKKFDAWMKKQDSEVAEQAEELRDEIITYCDCQGFILGFQYAMQLQRECNVIEKTFYDGKD